VRIRAVRLEPSGSRATISLPGRHTVELQLAVPGMHNVRNAAAALGVLQALGADVQAGAQALADFRGVGRRFERLGEARGVAVVDDYAHHPTEVTATLAAARQVFPGRRLVAVFQPHLYSRTALHGESLGKALAAADMVVVAPIYGAREQPLAGVTHHLVVRGATRAGAATVAVRDRAGLTQHVARAVREGDVVFTLGAGDVTRVGPELLEMLATEARSRSRRVKWPPPRRSRQVLLWAGAALAVMLVWMMAPLGLRRVAFFRVRQVELVGIRYLDADQVLAALQLSPRASVFDDTEVLVDRLRALDGIADVAVSRRPPHR